MLTRWIPAASLATTLLLPLAVLAAGTRTHVSNAGNDANTAFSCDATHPCRTFAAALTQTTPGGEILAIDSSGYGKVVIDRSVSIIAAPGIFAGIGVGAGGNATGVQIATAGVNVVLRGLAITGQGGTYGIHMTGGARLSVENCVVANFSSGAQLGMLVNTPAKVRVVNTTFRDNTGNSIFSGGATASVSDSKFLGGDVGLYVTDYYGGTSVVTTAFVDRSVASGGIYGFVAENHNSGNTSRLYVTDSVASNAGIGIRASSSAGSAKVSVSSSGVFGNSNGLAAAGSGTTLVANGNTVTGNAFGLIQSAGAAFESAGDNLVRDNVTASSGTISPVGKL